MTTSVSAEEAEMAFKESMIGSCNLNGKDIGNGYGSVDDCLYNFETLALEQCLSKIFDFKSKIYRSKADLKSDYFQFEMCATNIVTEAYLSKKVRDTQRFKLLSC